MGLHSVTFAMLCASTECALSCVLVFSEETDYLAHLSVKWEENNMLKEFDQARNLN